MAPEVADTAVSQVVAADAIPEDQWVRYWSKTRNMYADAIAEAQTALWNGPMGVFELAPFAAGTHALAQALADARAISVVGGGGDSAAVSG